MADSRIAYAAVSVEKMAVEGTVQSVIVEDDDRALDKVTLVLDDPHDDKREVFREGLRVKVDLGWGKDHAVLFEGVIISSKPVSQGGTTRLNVQAYDLGYALMKGPDTPPPDHLGKLSDIVRAVFTRAAAGVEVGEIAPDPDPEFTEDKPLRQGNEKDWQFIQRLAYSYKCRAFIEYNANASKFYFLPVRRLLQAKPQGTLKYCRGLSQLIEFSYERIASAAAARQSAAVMDPLSGESKVLAPPEPAATEPPATPSDRTRARLEGIGPTRAREYETAMEVAASAPGKPSEQVRRGALTQLPSDPALAEALIQPDPTRVLGFIGRGEVVGNVLFRAKGRVTIEGIAPWAAGDWYVRQVRHVYTRAVHDKKDRSTYRTHFIATR